jgi:phospholipase D1/2
MGTPVAALADVTRLYSSDASTWLRIMTIVVICLFMVAAFSWVPRPAVDFDAVTAWLLGHRRAWYALPVVMITFVILGLVMVPVILLIAATGVAFGPLLGPVYAMAGCLASASTGFAIGRAMGLPRVTQLGGERIARVARSLKRNGTLAVFLVRKVPAPFTLVNIVVGASAIRFRDFIVGTVLGMGVLVVGLAGFGYQAMSALRDPSAATLLGAAMFVVVPLILAVLINHSFRRLRPVE